MLSIFLCNMTTPWHSWGKAATGGENSIGKLGSHKWNLWKAGKTVRREGLEGNSWASDKSGGGRAWGHGMVFVYYHEIRVAVVCVIHIHVMFSNCSSVIISKNVRCYLVFPSVIFGEEFFYSISSGRRSQNGIDYQKSNPETSIQVRPGLGWW